MVPTDNNPLLQKRSYLETIIKFDNRKAFKILGFLSLVAGTITLYLLYKTPNVKFYDELYCYGYKGRSLTDISDISLPAGKKIFFLETSCKSHRKDKITINARQACAVESAAKLNPNYNVYLLYISPGNIEAEGTKSDNILQALLSYSNIKIYHAGVMKYVRGSYVEKLFINERVQQSHYKIEHSSDILRYLTLWKYGGIYLDLDVTILKNLDVLVENFSGAESEETVASGVMGFSPTGLGKEYITSCLKDIADNFDGNIWANSPAVITRFASRTCNKNSTKYRTTKVCKNFTIYGHESFYPIPYNQWRKYFEEEYNDEVKSALNNTIIIHWWNKMSSREKLRINANVTYMNYARQNCPKVVKELNDYF